MTLIKKSCIKCRHMTLHLRNQLCYPCWQRENNGKFLPNSSWKEPEACQLMLHIQFSEPQTKLLKEIAEKNYGKNVHAKNHYIKNLILKDMINYALKRK